MERKENETTGQWLKRTLREQGLNKQQVALVLGVNQARIHEWLAEASRMPEEAMANLRSWLNSGRPQFGYWIRPV